MEPVIEVTKEQVEKGLADYDAAVAWQRRLLSAAANEDAEAYAEKEAMAITLLTDEELDSIVNGFGFLREGVITLGRVVAAEYLQRRHVNGN